MIFSLFGKKAGRGSDRKPAAPPEKGVRERSGVGAAARRADPREVARLTAAKIDEIESEMIASPRPAAVPAAGARLAAAGAGPPSRVRGASTTAVAAAPPAPPARPAPDAQTGAGGAPDPSVPLDEPGPVAIGTQASGSALPPAFEEAAVLYSNGQATAAATVLWQATEDPSLDDHARQVWAMLFDLNQAIGHVEEFESLAIDYSTRFEASPPAWDAALAPPARSPRPAAGAAPSAVAMPVSLDAGALRQVEQVQRLAQRSRTVLLDLGPVRAVDASGAELLRRVLVAFARAQRELLVKGADALVALLAGSIAPGRRDPSQACWLLQLELLRLLGRQQEFEDLSIDYCVTYEVSPPPWEPMPASVRPVGAGDPAETAPSDRADAGFSATPEAFVLEGELTGPAQEVLAALRDYAGDRAEVVVDCRRLRRIDFVATGELLNEVVALRTGGKYLVFRELNQLVAALLSVMGIADLAEIRLRRQ